LLEAATIAGAETAGLQDTIGTLTPGKQADIILIRTDGVGVYPSQNAQGTVLHMVDRHDVSTVMVAGTIRKHEGKLVDVDLTALREATDESRKYLFKAVGYTPDPIDDSYATH
jgi:cytosine/adenosine deaminase-related metal-dependent hydrolase